MIAFDAGVLSLFLFPGAGILKDFRTDMPIDRAKDRVNALIEELEADGDVILLPAPALCEALVPVADQMDRIIEIIERQQCFKVSPFDKKTAIEVALRTKAAVDRGDKKEGIVAQWQKVKYDRQIVAIAKTEGASVIYAMDKDIHDHAKLWGLQVLHVADLSLPSAATQEEFFQNEEIQPIPPPA